jgi:IS1 family transposase
MGNDKTTDYEYSIPELRGLMKVCLKLKLGHTDDYRSYKKMLKQQEAAALRDWERVQKAMEKANTNTITIFKEAPPE